MTAPGLQRWSGWRGLGLFWAVIAGSVLSLCATLQVLGPPLPSTSRPSPAALHEQTAHAEPAPAPSRPGEVAEPVAALLEPSHLPGGGMLPRIAPDGRVARKLYARAATWDGKRPRIALLMTGLGDSAANSRAAIDGLPGPVSLSFSPYAGDTEKLLALSRQAGHEMLVSIPMEPQGFPLNDAGSHSLLTGATPAQNAANLDWALSRIQGYVGAVGALEGMRGERFAEQTSGWKAVLDELKRRGLLYVDPRPGKASDLLPQIPGRAVDLVVDDPPARAEIEGKLAGLERIAREKGSALGLAGPLRPMTIERIAAWSKTLADRGIDLVPVSALVAAAPAATAKEAAEDPIKQATSGSTAH